MCTGLPIIPNSPAQWHSRCIWGEGGAKLGTVFYSPVSARSREQPLPMTCWLLSCSCPLVDSKVVHHYCSTSITTHPIHWGVFFRCLVIILSIWRNQHYVSIPTCLPPASLPIIFPLYTHSAEICQKSSISQIRTAHFLFLGVFCRVSNEALKSFPRKRLQDCPNTCPSNLMTGWSPNMQLGSSYSMCCVLQS